MSSFAEPKPPARKINDPHALCNIYPVYAEEINREARDKHTTTNGRKRGGGGGKTGGGKKTRGVEKKKRGGKVSELKAASTQKKPL